MSKLDLNQKVWRLKAKIHIYAFAAIQLTLASLVLLLGVIDYTSLPSNVPKEIKEYFFEFIWRFAGRLIATFLCTVILLACPYRILYQVLSTIGLLFSTCVLLIKMILSIALQNVEFNDKFKLIHKHYKYGMPGKEFAIYSQFVVNICLCIVMIKFSFCDSAKDVPVARAAPHAQSANRMRREEDEQDDEDKPKSGRKSVKSGKSVKTNSLKTGSLKSKTEE